MPLTWFIKTKQYFTTKVSTKDRFRTNDKPTEEEYSNLFQSLVFKVHDLATIFLAGIVRKATRRDYLLGKDDKATMLSGYNHNEPLYMSPQLVNEFSVEAGTILSWIPCRKKFESNGVRFQDNTGNITDTDFSSMFSVLTSNAVNFYDPNVITYFETYYLSPRYRICDGRVVSFINPYNNLNETIALPDLRERVIRAGGVDNSLISDNKVFEQGGYDVQDLSHRHRVLDTEITTKVTVAIAPFALTAGQMPLHTHNYLEASATVASINLITSVSGPGVSTVVTTPTNLVTGIVNSSSATTSAGNGDSVNLSPVVNVSDPLDTTLEIPTDTINFPTGFSKVDNRQKFFNTYKIIAIY